MKKLTIKELEALASDSQRALRCEQSRIPFRLFQDTILTALQLKNQAAKDSTNALKYYQESRLQCQVAATFYAQVLRAEEKLAEASANKQTEDDGEKLHAILESV